MQGSEVEIMQLVKYETLKTMNLLSYMGEHVDCRFFYASSACIYPEFLQLNTEVEGGGLKESMAWPAQVCKNCLWNILDIRSNL